MIRSLDTNLVSKNLNWDVFKNKQKTTLKFNFFFDFWFFFLLFLQVLKVRRPGRKTSGFRTVWILKICRTSGPDMMSGRALPSGCGAHHWAVKMYVSKTVHMSLNGNGCKIMFYKQVGFSNRSTVKLAKNKLTQLWLILSHSFHCTYVV